MGFRWFYFYIKNFHSLVLSYNLYSYMLQKFVFDVLSWENVRQMFLWEFCFSFIWNWICDIGKDFDKCLGTCTLATYLIHLLSLFSLTQFLFHLFLPYMLYLLPSWWYFLHSHRKWQIYLIPLRHYYPSGFYLFIYLFMIRLIN